MRCSSPRFLTFLPLVVLTVLPAAAGDWPQFRGELRDGRSPETGLLDAWPEGGPREVWRQPIGEGYSALTVVGDRVYTLYAAPEGDKKLEFAAALEAATGEEVWRTAVGENLDTEFGNGPRATATVDGGRVYVLGSRGDLAALSAAGGAEAWSVRITDAFGSKVPDWGFSTSPLVDGDLLLVETGGPEGKSFAAFDKKTGEERWTTGAAGAAGYNSPMVLDAGGERRFVYLTGGRVRAIDASGGEIWSHPFAAFESHAMPIFIPPDRYFVSGVGGDGEGAAVLRVRENGAGAEVEEVWKSRVMKNHFSSSLLHDGHVYGFDNATFKCVSAETGEQTWAKRGLGKGSLIYADGRLIVLSDRGKLVLLEATHEAYRERGSVQALTGKSWTAPSLAGGRLYLRNHGERVCYDLAG